MNENTFVVEGKRFLVLGGGVSGRAAAAFLRSKGAFVTLADEKPKDEVAEAVLALAEKGVSLCLGGMPEQVSDYDFAVISPGIPLTVPVAKALQAQHIPILGELELAYLFSHTPYLAITGTNGKTTTTSLLGYILQQAGIECIVGGNIGEPLVTRVEQLSQEGYIVAEVSSFQLETTNKFCPQVAAYLNLTPDHLNRHGTMKQYGDIKAKIFQNQGPTDVLVCNYDDPLVRAYAEQAPGKVVFFSRREILPKGIFVEGPNIVYWENGKKQQLIAMHDIFIKGGHNMENVMAASAMALAIGIEKENIAQALRTFPGVTHRQEFVCVKDGVTYINDSKGTNPDSTLQALLAYDQPMVLILGGRDKGGDFRPLLPLIQQKVRQVVLVGEATPILKQALASVNYSHWVEAGDDFAKAVTLATAASQPGDIVMLSPACASWDMFSSFEARGDLFKQLVLGK